MVVSMGALALLQYSFTISAKDDIKRYFNSLQVSFIPNKKECQVQWVLN